MAPAGLTSASDEPALLEDAEGLLHLALEMLTEQLDGVVASSSDSAATELCKLVIELQRAQQELYAFRTDQRTAALANVQEGLSRLGGVVSVQKILERATEEVCRTCGFDRAVLFRVHGPCLLAESAHVRGDAEASRELLEAAGAYRLTLTPEFVEAEVLRRRVPKLVDPGDESVKAAAGLLPIHHGADSYVVAPIASAGRVIGVISADFFVTGRGVDRIDRDVLWAFAEGFGYAVERSVLVQRLSIHRQKMGELAALSREALDELCDADVELGCPEGVAVLSPRDGLAIPPDTAGSSRLTRRELEVMQLLATGATNANIAQRLVVSEDTIKSHIRHILRKLNAGNRLEAVARFNRGPV